MADIGKMKTPVSQAKKGQDGGGKKRRKHKKSQNAAGDSGPSLGTTTASSPATALSPVSAPLPAAALSSVSASSPVSATSPVSLTSLVTAQSQGAVSSPVSASVQSNQNQMSASQSQTRQNGATASTKGTNERKDSETLGKSLSKTQDNKELRGSEHIVKSSPSHADNDRKSGLRQEQNTLDHRSKSRKDKEPLEKREQREDIHSGAVPLKNAVKEENKEAQDGERPRNNTAKPAGKGRKESEPTETGLERHSGKKKDNEMPAQEGAQQISNAHDKLQQGKKGKPQGEKLAESQDQQSRKGRPHGEKLSESQDIPQKTKEDIVDGEHRQRPKVEPGNRPQAVDGEKSKSQLRAERRAIQEAQRAAKEGKKNESFGGSSVVSISSANTITDKKESASDKPKSVSDKSKSMSDKSKPGNDKQRPARELPAGEKRFKKKSAANALIHAETEEQMWTKKENEILGKSLKIDNSIMNLGFQYFHHNIVGANARCMALLATLKEVITKYRTPDEKELSRDLEKNFLNPCISYINYCRPISTGMGNAIKHLKYHISQIPNDMEDEEAISKLRDVIDTFIQDNIIKAAEAVAHYADKKIDNGDVILVYAASSLIGQLFHYAFKEGKRFRVIVVEGRPRSEGKSMLRYLVRCGIPCSYIYIGSASHAMSEATKVFLGAAAMFAIGDMYSRCGNSMIAALAKANNIPVLVCCETYKFTDKVQLHTTDSNLHTRGKDLVSIGHKTPILANWEEIGLGLLNLMYDVTGSEYITAVVTELGMLPCTSVPVVLRRQEDLY